jgi:hypothetical protein
MSRETWIVDGDDEVKGLHTARLQEEEQLVRDLDIGMMVTIESFLQGEVIAARLRHRHLDLAWPIQMRTNAWIVFCRRRQWKENVRTATLQQQR